MTPCVVPKLVFNAQKQEQGFDRVNGIMDSWNKTLGVSLDIFG